MKTKMGTFIEAANFPLKSKDGTHRTMGTVLGDVEVWVDARALAYMLANRATSNKSRATKLGKGAIEVRCIRRRDIHNGEEAN